MACLITHCIVTLAHLVIICILDRRQAQAVFFFLFFFLFLFFVFSFSFFFFVDIYNEKGNLVLENRSSSSFAPFDMKGVLGNEF